MTDAAAVHVNEGVGDLLEDLDEAGHREPGDVVERLAVDVFKQEVDLADAEEPVAFAFELVDLEQVRMPEQAGDAELEAAWSRNFFSSRPEIGTTFRAYCRPSFLRRT